MLLLIPKGSVRERVEEEIMPRSRISEFKLVNRSRELVNSQFELGPDRSSPSWVT